MLKRPRLHGRRWVVIALVSILASVLPNRLTGQDVLPGPQLAKYPAFSLQSPYRSLAKTRQLLNTVSNQILLYLDYTEQDGTWTPAEWPQ